MSRYVPHQQKRQILVFLQQWCHRPHHFQMFWQNYTPSGSMALCSTVWQNTWWDLGPPWCANKNYFNKRIKKELGYSTTQLEINFSPSRPVYCGSLSSSVPFLPVHSFPSPATLDPFTSMLHLPKTHCTTSCYSGCKLNSILSAGLGQL